MEFSKKAAIENVAKNNQRFFKAKNAGGFLKGNMTNIEDRLLKEASDRLKYIGGFLTSGNNPPNIMAMAWGAIGFFWNKPVFIAPVRYNKYTNDLIEKHHEFAVNFPRKDHSETIAKAANISGRTGINKFEYLNLHAGKCRTIDSYIVSDFDIHLECRVIFKTGMEVFQLIDQEIKKEYYEDKNFHSFYFAEIVDVYETT